MKIFFYSNVRFEPWDYRNPDTVGIGGSETAQIQMAERLAARGYDVTSYAPIPHDAEGIHKGVRWLPLAAADFVQEGLWIMSRCPHAAKNFKKSANQKLWLICQDVDYPNIDQKTGYPIADHLEPFNRIVALCRTQQEFLKMKYPKVADKVCLSSNGLRRDLIEEVEKLNIPRNPKKVIFSSSPDRGLNALLKIFRRASEYVPDLKLSIAYGWDNIDKFLHVSPQTRLLKKEIMDLVEKTPGITFCGRLPQKELYKEIFSSGVYVSCTDFKETSMISCMEMQAAGAYAIFSPLWAAQENIQHGIFIHGYPDDPITISRFANALVSVVNNPEQQEVLRKPMMTYARDRFDWEKIVTQFDSWIKEY